MKKYINLIILLVLLSSLGFSQSILIEPTTDLSTQITKIKKRGIGLSHESTNGAVKLGTYVDNSYAYIQTHSNHALNFATANGPATMTLATNGNLGIGVTSPTDKLHVAGSSLFEGNSVFEKNLDINQNLTVSGLSEFENMTINGTLNVYDPSTFASTVSINAPLTVSSSSDFTSLSVTNFDFGSIVNMYDLNVNTITPLSSPSLIVNGDLDVQGYISKLGGTFRIDHPLQPEEKYLYHSFIESPDMMNVYNGNVYTDEQGNATVTLPDYFNALNIDFRYQLTPIGQFAQAIISEEIVANEFQIKTDKPNVKVSWQVTGIRNDTYAKENRIKVSVEKPESEKGTLLYSSKTNKL